MKKLITSLATRSDARFIIKRSIQPKLKKYNRMKKSIITLLALAALLLKACFKDDLSDCPANLQLYFESVITKYKYEEVTNRLDLYLYNGADALAGIYSYSQEELKEINYRPVLPLGTCERYTLLALVNAGDDYIVTRAEQLNTFKVSLRTTVGDTVKKKQEDLFFARKEIQNTEPGSSGRWIYETLPLYKNTNHIFVNVTIESPDNSQLHALQAYIQGNNGSFNNQNNCYPISNRVYLPHKTTIETGSINIQYQFTTMQIRTDSDLILFFHENEEEMLKLIIMDQLSKVYDTNEKLEKEDVFYLDLILKNDYTIIELQVNGWYTIQSGVEV